MYIETVNERFLAKAQRRQGRDHDRPFHFHESKTKNLCAFTSLRETFYQNPHQQPIPTGTSPNPKNVEIFKSVEQKIPPLHAQLPQHQLKPHQQPSNTEHPNHKKRAFFKICPRKLSPL
jgi:hypothetical protein